MRSALLATTIFLLAIFSTIFVFNSDGISQMPVPSPVQTPNIPGGAYYPNEITRDDNEVYPPVDPGYYWIKSNDDAGGRIEVNSESSSFGDMFPASCHFALCQIGSVLGYTPFPTSTGYGVDTGTYFTTDGIGGFSRLATVTIVAYAPDDAENAGESCPAVGQPVNVTNGNMWLSQTDFVLPGLGKQIEVTRFYNSIIQTSGIFGHGWSTIFDQSLQIPLSNLARLNMPDGRAVYFVRQTPNGLFMPHTAGVQAFIEANTGGGHTLNFKDGIKHRFNANGKLESITDRNGNQTTLNYTNNILTGITDASGRTLTINMSDGLVQNIRYDNQTIATYTYYQNTSNLETVNYQDGSQYKFEYDTTTVTGKTFLKTVKDATNKILETHEYDAQGRATTSEKEGGVEKYIFDYTNANNYPTSPYTLVKHKLNASDPNFIETKYYFDKSKPKNFVWKTEGNCNCGGSAEVTIFEYDDRLNLKKKREQISTDVWRETAFTYNYQGDVLTKTDFVGSTNLGTESFTYNPYGQLLTATDKMGGVTTNTYSTTGNLLTSKDALNNTTTLVYPTTNNKGLPDSIKDARNNITKFKWYASGPQKDLLEEVEDPYTKKTNFTWDARGRIDTITNALGHVTDYNYFDDTQRKVEMIYPNLDKITYNFDIRRLPESTTNERGKVTTYEFDPQYRLKKITDPLGHVKEFGYDDMSNIKLYKDALGNQTDYRYDDFDRLKEIEYPAATVGATRLKERFEYDKLGRIKKYFDTADRLTEYAYNDSIRTNTVTNPELEVTIIKYNARGQTFEVKDAINQVYTFAYDPLGRVLTQTRAGGTMSFEYDQVGNRKKRTDYMGRVTNYTFDNLNRLTKVEYDHTNQTPKPQSTYGYDDISRLTSAVNEAGTVTFGYDNRNRMTSTTDVFNQALVYEYERTPTVNQTRLKLNGSLYATYNFDNAERLQNIVNASDSTTIGFTYFDDDAVQTRTYPNGVTTNYLYDNMRRLTRLTDAGPSGTLFDRQYGYNSANQISQITEPSLSRIFTYDNIDRLRTVANGGTGENYNYDDVGNRTSSHLSSTYGYQPFNKVTSTQTATYGYDANGNTVSKSEGKEFWRYTWDYENRLVQASTRKTPVRYKYDALGRRVQRVVGFSKENTKFTYDDDDVLVDDDAGTLTKYLNGEGIDNKLRATTGSSTNYFLADHLGSTNGLANASGSLTSSNSYDSFGMPTNNGFPSRYQFTGREYDSFSGLQFSRARFYDPNLGRSISEDPIGLGGGINQYSYVSNNSLNATDPFGMYEIDVHYYLTYYLARQNGCFTEIDAQYIAFSNQFVDDNSGTRPGWGGDERQRGVNREYHGLHPGNNNSFMNKRWEGTNSGSWPSRLSSLGSSLHYEQDRYSHAGYPSSKSGHLSGTHSVDKTDSDVNKAMAMAQATFNTLNAFSSKHCKCVGKWTPEMSDQIQRFAALPGGNFITRYIDSIENNNPSYLNNKKNALGF